MSTCNWLDLESSNSWPTLPKTTWALVVILISNSGHVQDEVEDTRVGKDCRNYLASHLNNVMLHCYEYEPGSPHLIMLSYRVMKSEGETTHTHSKMHGLITEFNGQGEKKFGLDMCPTLRSLVSDMMVPLLLGINIHYPTPIQDGCLVGLKTPFLGLEFKGRPHTF